MCGIAGIISWQPLDQAEAIKVSKLLLVGIQHRGRKATGIASINTRTGSVEVQKKPILAEDFIKDNENFQLVEGSNVILLHTRQPTHGDIQNSKNNHPIYDKTDGSVLIHNGVVSLRDKSRYKITKDGETDSEIILRVFQKTGGKMKKTIGEIEGSLAIALYRDKRLWLYAWENPLSICWVEKLHAFAFASEADTLVEVFGSVVKIFGLQLTNSAIPIKTFEDGEGRAFDFRTKSTFKFLAEPYEEPYVSIKSSGWAPASTSWGSWEEVQEQEARMAEEHQKEKQKEVERDGVI